MSKTYRLSLYVTVPQTPVRPENSVRVCRVSNGRNIRGDRGAGALPREFGSPWFRFPTNAAGTVRTACECAYFRARAACRWPIRMVGIVGHLQPMVLVPSPAGPRAILPLGIGESR